MRAISLVILLCSCGLVGAVEQRQHISLVAALANPSALDGKHVIITGYVCASGTKRFGLYLTRGDCKDANYANAIALDLSALRKSVPQRPTLLTVEGRFTDRTKRVYVDDPFTWGEVHVTNISGRTVN
jgi:hypothetical protein